MAAEFSASERAIRWTTTLSVIVLASIAAVVSYKHMYELVLRYGETSWTAALLPVSVDGMIVASSMSLLLDSRCGRRSGLLPWTLLVIGSAASLAANVAVAEPSAVGRLIAGWPSCALIGAYELLMGQIRHTAAQKADLDNAASEAPQRSAEVTRRRSEESHRSPRAAREPSYEALRTHGVAPEATCRQGEPSPPNFSAASGGDAWSNRLALPVTWTRSLPDRARDASDSGPMVRQE